MKLFILLLFVSFNLFARNYCNPPLTLGGGQDYNQAILVVVKELCTGKKTAFEALKLKGLDEALNKCLETFDCKRAKEDFLQKIIDGEKEASSKSGEKRLRIIKRLQENPQTSRFVDSTSPDRYMLTVRTYKRDMKDVAEKVKRELRFEIKQVERNKEKALKSKRELEEYKEKCKPMGNCDEKTISKLETKLKEDLEFITSSEAKVKSIIKRFDPDNLSQKVKESVAKYHKETIKALEQRAKTDPTCKGLGKTTIEECAQVSVEFRSKYLETQEEFERVSDLYKDFDKELKEKIDDNELVNLMFLASLDQVREELGIDQGDDSYMLDELYKKMDDSLLGKYIDEKTVAAACAFQDGVKGCNLGAGTEQLSIIQGISKQIEKQTKDIRELKR